MADKARQSGVGAVTMADIARKAKVTKATVSYVLNGHSREKGISGATRDRIIKIAHALNYHPSASARALSTKKSRQIAFLLSDVVEDGLANAWFSRCLCSVEKVCRQRNYNLVVNLYNLSDIDSFVYPTSLLSRNVDGVVLNGYVEEMVIKKFEQAGLPCVSIGDNLEVSVDAIPAIAADILGGLSRAVSYLADLGHVRIGYQTNDVRRDIEVKDALSQWTNENLSTSQCEIVPMFTPISSGGYESAKLLAKQYFELGESQRPTAVIGSDQAMLRLISCLERRGIHCPRDVSLLAKCNSKLCELTRPELTAIDLRENELAAKAAELLINHLEGDTALSIDRAEAYGECGLVVRSSCARPCSDKPEK